MDIFVHGSAKAWNDSRPVDVRAVVADVARQFMRHLDQSPLPAVLWVKPGSPLTQYFKNGDDSRVIFIHCGTRDWCQLAYQFAHEFCHLLTVPDRLGNSENNWFVEAICELASVFALTKMSMSWKTHPPYSNWVSYAPHLASYVERHLDQMVKLREDQTLPDWLAANEGLLRRDSTNRPLNQVVAHALFPVFDENPNLWDALQYFPTVGEDLSEYLCCWHNHAPKKHQAAIASIVDQFRISLKSP